MLAALTLFLVLTLSVLVVRTGAVALRLTGLSDEVARFQARSAFTGAGFTTSESEAVVNHPVRRRIVSMLMLIGSIGLVSVITTTVVSVVRVDDVQGGVLRQLAWLGAVLALLWGVALNPRIDRIMCAAIGRVIERTSGLGARRPLRLLQMPAGHGVTRVLVYRESGLAGRRLGELIPRDLVVLALEREDGTFISQPDVDAAIRVFDELYVYGPDSAVDALLAAPADAPR